MFLKLGVMSKFYILNWITLYEFALFLQEVFSRNLDQFDKGEVTVIWHSSQLYKKSYVSQYPLQNIDLISK